jgi:predicted N-acetyltransferase YhbS
VSICEASGEAHGKADGSPRVVLEVLATIHDYKGRGAGKMLLEWGCDQADKEGVEVFVETNHAALPFYQKFGFELKADAEMPGGFGYTEYVLVRPAKN